MNTTFAADNIILDPEMQSSGTPSPTPVSQRKLPGFLNFLTINETACATSNSLAILQSDGIWKRKRNVGDLIACAIEIELPDQFERSRESN
jgi:hypothetical protein